MTTNRSTADGPARRAIAPRSWARPPGLALLGLALYGLIQSGCAFDGCSTCGFGSRIARGVQALGDSARSVGAAVFHHKRGCGGGFDCGCGGEEGLIVDQGVQVVPGAMAVPAPGTIVPPPAIESTPPQLEALPDSKSANPTSGTGNTPGKSSTSRNAPGGGTNRSAYTTMQPKVNSAQRRGSEIAQALHSTPAASNRPADPNASADLLDNIPPVDLPSEVTRKAVNSAATFPAPAASPAPAAAPASPPIAPTAAEKVSAAEGETATLPAINAVTAHQAPGLHRFASIAPLVGGGSSPSIEGLDWLKEKGYRTFLDLRKGSEVEPNFVDAVNDRGMVYISLPILATRLDPSRLARFDDLISHADNRPLFFCDTDGTRAGLVWYIHLRTVDQEDSQAATSKAEEIGLTDAQVKLAEDYLAVHKPKARAALARVAQATPPTPTAPGPEPTPAESVPAAPASALPVSPATPAPAVTPAVVPPPAQEPTPSMLPGEHRPQASREPAPDYRDPASWRPAAALVLTGIGVPLAFWGRSVFSEARSVRRRASLPGRVPRSLGAPAGSDA